MLFRDIRRIPVIDTRKPIAPELIVGRYLKIQVFNRGKTVLVEPT